MFLKSLRAVAACFALVVAAPAFADEAPVDLDTPDTIVDTAEAEQAVSAADAAAAALVAATPLLANRIEGRPSGDSQFRSIFSAWRQMDGPAAQALAIPSRRPVDEMRLTSSFGHRSDPFTGRRARHNGIDIPGPVGTPIYATADGYVSKAEWFSSYGNFISLEHGAQLQTRYAHMSRMTVSAGQRVKKGDIIGYVGSTGRSTGPHLHYEVRIAGSAVNPLPYMNGIAPSLPAPSAVAMGGGDDEIE